MNTEQQQQQGQDGASAGGGAAPDNKSPAQVLGTATRQPIFPAGAAPSTQQQGGDVQQDGTTGAPPKGRGPITTAGIPESSLKARLDRTRDQERAAWLKELGAKTPEEAREKLAKLKTAEQEAEKRRLAEMGEVERLKAELANKDARIAELEAQIASFEQAREHEQHEQVIGRVATELVDSDALALFKLHLAQHVKKLAGTNPELAEKFGERGIRRFAEKWTKEHPKFARAATAAPPPATAPAGKPAAAAPAAPKPVPAPVRRPVTTGIPPRRNPSPPANTQAGGTTGKTPRPGLANSMSPAEVKAFAAKNGITYNPI